MLFQFLFGFVITKDFWTPVLNEVSNEFYEKYNSTNGLELIFIRDEDEMNFFLGLYTPLENQLGLSHIVEHVIVYSDSEKLQTSDRLGWVVQQSGQCLRKTAAFQQFVASRVVLSG